MHWTRDLVEQPIERLNRELKRRADVVQTFPDAGSVMRLVGALLVEVNDDLIAAPRRYVAGATLTPLLADPDHALTSLPAALRT